MENRSPGLVRPTLTRPQMRGLVAAIGILAIAVSLLLVARPAGTPTGSPGSSPVAVESPSAAPPTPAPRATPAPSAPAEIWGPLSLEPFEPVATLAAATADAAGVAPSARFAFVSLTDEPATEAARRLETLPPTTLKVTSGTDARHATVTPAKALRAGQTYKFILRSADGTLQGSWAFRVRGPVRVTTTLPGNATTGVPVATGIEVTFDQEGVADMAPFFSIEPATKGRFEQHGRTQVFVPDALKPATTYTVRIKAGLPRTGTDLKLERDLVFSFETAGAAPGAFRWLAGRDVLEVSPAEAPAIGLVVARIDDQEGPSTIPTTVAVKVYRYPSSAAAVDALQAFLRAPRWMEYSGPVLATSGLDLATSFTAELTTLADPYGGEGEDRVVRFPARLPVGAYAVEIGGKVPAYVFLQVTRVSAWVSVLSDRTVLWVNDVVSHQPIAGATVALPGKDAFGTSQADGIVNARTPSALQPAAVSGQSAPVPPVLVVRSGTSRLLVAFDAASAGDVYRGEWWETVGSGDETYWSLLESDRWQYRISDSVAAWGYLRGRDAGTVPAEVTLRLVPYASSDDISAPAIAELRVKPDAVGVYSAKLAFDRAPLGGYKLVAVVGNRVVASRILHVTVIRKPDYELSLATDHRAVLAGSAIKLTGTASFFDGTPVPGLDLSFGIDDVSTQETTNAGGVATGTLTVTYPDWEDGSDPRWRWLSVRPVGAEGGEISADGDVLVFAASEHLAGSGTLTGDRLHVAATLRGVDLAAIERQLALGDWDGDPRGVPIAGRKVSVVVTQHIPVKTKIGTRYDYIEKVVVPIYSYDIQKKVLTSASITSDSRGRIVLDLTVPSADHQYEVALTTKDSGGRAVVRTVWIGQEFSEAPYDTVRFERTDGASMNGQRYRVGEQIDWTMTGATGAPLPTSDTDRYLYIVAQRGLVAIETGNAPRFRRTFAASDAPGIFVMGVRFTGTTYAPKAASWANFDVAQRQIKVTVTADKAGYRPGDDITLTVRTVNEAGLPVDAEVVLQAVDEKLFAMGAASTPEPMEQLYVRVDSGIVRLTSTHQVPTGSGHEGEGGGEGGGSPRSDFRDMLAFVRLQTGTDGRATTVIHASDDLTSWHVSASALTAGLEAGVGELLFPVGLPVFANVTVADEYLVSDRPAVRLRAYGTELRAGDPVRFTIGSQSLGLATTTIDSTAFTDVWVPLPALTLGQHSLDVGVVATTRHDAGGAPFSDRLIAPFNVVGSRLVVDRAAYGQLGGSVPTAPRGTAATYTFTDAGRGRYLPILLDLAESGSIRLDRGLARSLARAMLEDEFGRSQDSFSPDTFDVTRYDIDGPLSPDYGSDLAGWEQFGIPLLPYGGPDPDLMARIVILDPAAPPASEVRWMLGLIRSDDAQPRSLRIAAVAALAALGEPVLADVATLRSEPNLNDMEQINLGLAAAALGDESTAREIERALLADHGQRLGPWVRINVGGNADGIAEATAALAVLAARIGDPLAPAMLDFVLAHPSTQASLDLEAAAVIAAALERTPAATASFAYTVDGKRTVVSLSGNDGATIALTATQVASLQLERLAGDIGVTVAWREAAGPGGQANDPTISLARTAPDAAPADRMVTVSLVATFRKDALSAPCYVVVEQVPSGLAPLEGQMRYEEDSKVVWPSEVIGQEVRFCVAPDPAHPGTTVTMRYLARVVSTGTFTWEPAAMGLEGVSEVATMTTGGVVRIGG